MNELLKILLGPAITLGVVYGGYALKVRDVARNAPSREEVTKAIRDAQDKVLNEIKPLREDVTKQGVHIEWIVNTLKERK